MAAKKKVTKKRVAKKAVKKRMPMRVDLDALAELELDDSVERVTGKQGRRRYDKMKLEAMAIYVTDVDGLTIKELAQDPRFKGNVSVDTLRKWAEEGEWPELRRKSLAKVREALAVKLAQTLEYNYVRSFEDMIALRRETMARFPEVRNGTFPQHGNLLIQIDQRLELLFEKMQVGGINAVGELQSKTEDRRSFPGIEGYDAKALREAGTMINRKRTSAHRARLAKTEAMQDGAAKDESG